MERAHIAYFLIALIIALLAGTIVYLRYHSRERTYLRRQMRERREYERRMEAKERAGDGL